MPGEVREEQERRQRDERARGSPQSHLGIKRLAQNKVPAGVNENAGQKKRSDGDSTGIGRDGIEEESPGDGHRGDGWQSAGKARVNDEGRQDVDLRAEPMAEAAKGACEKDADPDRDQQQEDVELSHGTITQTSSSLLTLTASFTRASR